jgi:hypothetical protein
MQKLMQKFGGIHRMDIVLTHLRDQLDSPHGMRGLHLFVALHHQLIID